MEKLKLKFKEWLSNVRITTASASSYTLIKTTKGRDNVEKRVVIRADHVDSYFKAVKALRYWTSLLQNATVTLEVDTRVNTQIKVKES